MRKVIIAVLAMLVVGAFYCQVANLSPEDSGSVMGLTWHLAFYYVLIPGAVYDLARRAIDSRKVA